jgi:hypothetical protein
MGALVGPDTGPVMAVVVAAAMAEVAVVATVVVEVVDLTVVVAHAMNPALTTRIRRESSSSLA